MSHTKSTHSILVTKPGAAGKQLCALLESQGYKAIYFPTISFAPPQDTLAFQQAIGQLAQNDWLIFISPQAVKASAGAIHQRWPALPQQIKIAAVGKGTAKALEAAGFTVSLYPTEQSGSEALLAAPRLQSIAHQKIVIIRGDGGREHLAETLRARGAEVRQVTAYRRQLPQTDITQVSALLDEKKITLVIATSFEGVKNLKQLLGKAAWPALRSLPLVVVSERIKRLARDLGFQTIWIAQDASSESLLNIIHMKERQ